MTSEIHPDDLPELPDMPEVAPAAAPLGVPAAPAALAGARPPLRVLDKAPQHLRLAAVIVMAGCVLAWMPGRFEGPTGGAWWIWALLGKAVMGIAAWLWLQQVRHDFGPKLQGGLGKLAELSLKPRKKADGEDGAKARRAKAAPTMHLEHPFPTGLHLLALLLVIAAVVVAWKDPRVGFANVPSGVPEVVIFGWAAFTWVHIAGYERWRHFNPLFPLMFLGMLFAGAAAVLGGLNSDAGGLIKLMAIAGGATVAAGGGLAAYTIAEAMMQAKKEGDRKKADALEARKAARQKKA